MRRNLSKFIKVAPTLFESSTVAAAKISDSNLVGELKLNRKVTGRLVIARHGETDLNAYKIWTGHHDAQLNDTGYEQAEQLGKSLRDHNFRPNIVLLSPLSRSIHTVSIAMREMNCFDAKIERLTSLVELSPGDHTGKPKNTDNKEFTRSWTVKPPHMSADHELHPENIKLGAQHRNFFPMPFGESFEDVENRTRSVYQYILQLLSDGQDVFVVAHSNSLSALFSHFSGEKAKIKFDNGVPLEIELEEKSGELVFVRTKKLKEISEEDRDVSSSQISVGEELAVSEMPSCMTKMTKAITLDDRASKNRKDEGRTS